jgi:hypothetical protein
MNTRPRRRALLPFVAILALVVGTASPAGATNGMPEKEVPFSAVITSTEFGFNTDPDAVAARCGDVARAFSVTTTRAVGTATHLGRIDLVADHCSYLDESGNPGPYTKGELSITAANGDVLLGTYTDGMSLTPPPLIEFVDVFTFVDGGTGRFIEASGGGVEVGIFNMATGEIVLRMEGVIAFDASNRRSD